MKNPNYLDLLAKHGVDGAHPGGLALTRELLRRESIKNNTMLLDVGCGTGQTSAYLAQNYKCRVFAVDNNPEMLEKASRRFMKYNLDVRLLRADVTELPFTSDSFDIVLAESVTIFTTIEKTLNEYSRVLKHDGTLIDIEMTAETPLSAGELNNIRSVYNIQQVPTQEEWTKMLRKAGFSEIKIHNVKMRPWQNFMSPQMARDFNTHFSLLRYYSRKLGYRVYRCRF